MASPDREAPHMILVMGVTGAGKSTFCNTLARRNAAKVGHDLIACTAVAQAIPATIGNSNLILIDTPGFDDAERTDSEILEEISKLLTLQYQTGMKLKGAVYLHRISDVRYMWASVKTLKIFEKVCGEKAFSNVVLATSRWNEVEESVGGERERQLREDFWTYMLSNGSSLARFRGSYESAAGIVGRLLGKGNIVLDLQSEIVDQGKRLEQTQAGAMVSDDVASLKAEFEARLHEIKQLRENLAASDLRLRKKMKEDIRQEQARLKQAEADQVRLRQQIAEEVRAEVKEEIRNAGGRSSGKKSILVSTAISLLNLFFNMDPTAGQTIGDWFSDLSDFSFGDVFGNFLSSF